MIYTLITVIALTLIYVLIIVRKYTEFSDKKQPKIKQLKERIEKLSDGIETETKLAKTARLTVEDRKVAVSDLKMQISTAQRELAEEKQVGEQLEIGRYKKEFKRKS